jgi:hypothetical protein
MTMRAGDARAFSWLLVLALAAAVGGCGAKRDDAKERMAIGATIDAAYDGFTHARGRELCEQLTPEARRAWTAVLADRVPLVKGRPCARQWTTVYLRVPLSMQPRFADEVANWNRGGTTVAGDTAKVRFEDGAVWELRRIGGRWRIDRLPILPRGWSDPSGRLTD